MNRVTRRHTKLGLARVMLVVMALVVGSGAYQPPADDPATTVKAPDPGFDWVTVVNNNDLMPPLNVKNFNSYNQPSVNVDGLVVIRARSRGGHGAGGGGGGGEPGAGNEPGGGHGPTHGIYTRDMSVEGPIISILDRTSEVPWPNNTNYPPNNPSLTTFVETPSFPRIDMNSDTIATRGNHQPAWVYTPPGSVDETRVGTTGIYTNPFGSLITGASKLGAVPEFSFFEVPEFPDDIPFDVFPGSPSVTQGDTIVFKGNYTDPDNNAGTGVYFRELEDEPAGGDSPVVLIANSTDTFIPGTDTVFGSTSPPSAAGNKVVFAGFDNENDPTLGGLYLAHLKSKRPLTTLVSIGGQVPGKSTNDTFIGLGEGVAFDGRFVGFWGAWGDETKTVRLYCPTEGNRDRIAYCNRELVCADAGEDDKPLGDDNSFPDDVGRWYQEKVVPVNQGIFVHDVETDSTRLVANTGGQFDEFLFWNYSGRTPCVGNSGHAEEGAEEDGEHVRWRSSAFVAVSGGVGATFNAVFKARTGELNEDGVYREPVDGIYLSYLGRGLEQGQAVETVLDTTMDGRSLDPEAPAGSTISELGLEREGLRGDWLVVNAKMGIEGGEEEDDMAGIYVTRVPTTPRR